MSVSFLNIDLGKQGDAQRCTLWCQLEDMFQLIVMSQGIEKVMIKLIDTPTKVYAIGARFIKGAPAYKCFKIGY